MAEVRRRHEPYSKLKSYLVENRIQQREIADLLGKSVSALNQNLNGTGGDFSVPEIRLICARYNISADEYFICLGVSNLKRKEANNTA